MNSNRGSSNKLIESDMSRVNLEIIACRSDIARSLPDSCRSSGYGPITVHVRVAELIFFVPVSFIDLLY
jgi:hypothetical protein